jgi:hypothetical protein
VRCCISVALILSIAPLEIVEQETSKSSLKPGNSLAKEWTGQNPCPCSLYCVLYCSSQADDQYSQSANIKATSEAWHRCDCQHAAILARLLTIDFPSSTKNRRIYEGATILTSRTIARTSDRQSRPCGSGRGLGAHVDTSQTVKARVHSALLNYDGPLEPNGGT